ncbi:MAG: hypothetical protein M1814_001782 [Vezdaea aestivalis]|nr:MAG: hypothetical protein M1814_001782 [Vezdaea aestivalis]
MSSSSLSETVSSTVSSIISSTAASTASSTSALTTNPPSIKGAFDRGGNAQSSESRTVGQFVATLGAALPIFAIQVGIFILLKNKLRRLYSPRSYLVPEIERFAPPPTGWLNWIRPVFKTKDKEFIQKSGLDAFFFIRYLFMLLKIFVPLTCVVVPILIPINQVGGRGSTFALGKTNGATNVTGLDQLSWANVKPENSNRYWAHCILAVGVIVFCCFVFYQEMFYYIGIRQDYLTAPQHRTRASATTVLVRSVPDRLLDDATLRKMFSNCQGGVKNIWINRNFDNLLDKTKIRLQLSKELELAEMNLIVKCNEIHQKRMKKKKSSDDVEAPMSSPDSDQRPESGETMAGKVREPLWKQYITQKDRETMRLPMYGWNWVWALPSWLRFGKKVDTIDFCRSEVAKLNKEISEAQANPEKYPHVNSAFIQFHNQVAAHLACQALGNKLPKEMTPRIIEIDPKDVIWDNMSIKWWEQYLRTAAILVLVLGLIICWAIPVTFASAASNLSYLQTIAWLKWLGALPKWFRSVVQGILSPALLGALLALLPVILRLLSRLQGIETGMGVELSVQNYYFGFLFVQLFLFVSIASGLTVIAQQLVENVTNIPSLLAANLPKASNFFLSYIILQGLTVSAGALLQVGPLIGLFILAKLFDKTARQKWFRETNLQQVQWGSFFPVYTNLACIGIIYSVIAPVILILLCVTFGLFWFASRYNSIFVFRFRIDTGGLVFPRAINQLFTGLYVMELCLIGLFLLVRNQAEDPICFPQAIIMIIMFFSTFLYQIFLNRTFDPLIKYLPLELHLEDRFGWDGEVAQPLTTSVPLTPLPEHSSKDLEAQPETPTSPEHDPPPPDLRREDPTLPVELQHMTSETKQPQSNIHPALRPLPVLSSITKGVSAATSSVARNVTSTARGAAKGVSKNTFGAAQNLAAQQAARDAAAQRRSVRRGHALFHGLADEMEDLEPDERDVLVRRAFLHEALRARRPVAWIPRDELGIADSEVEEGQRVAGRELWVSDEGCALVRGPRGKMTVVYERSPPDFDELDIIRL